MSMGKKGEQASFPRDFEAVSVGCNLDAVNRFTGQAIRRAQNLDWTDKIRFLDRRHYEHDDAPLLVQGTFPAQITVGRGHPGFTMQLGASRCQALDCAFGENCLNSGAKEWLSIRRIAAYPR